MSEGVAASPSLAERTVLPGLTAGAIALALAGPPVARRARRNRVLTQLLPDSLIESGVIIGLAAVGWAAIAMAEHVRPYRSEWAQDQGDTTANVAHLVLTTAVSGLTVKLIEGSTERAAEVIANTTGLARRWPRSRPLIARVGLAMLVSEFVHYWQHRISHERSPFWQVHAIHHGMTRLYWMNAVRFHPFDNVPMIVLQNVALRSIGIDNDALVAHSVLKAIHGQIQHSNIDGDSRPLRWVFSTTEHHRWHHSDVRAESNSNYGAVFSIWDRVFGTYLLPDEGPDRVRVGSRRVPPMALSWTGQLIAPFRRSTDWRAWSKASAGTMAPSVLEGR